MTLQNAFNLDVTTPDGQRAFIAVYGKMQQAQVYASQAAKMLNIAKGAKSLALLRASLRDARHLIMDAEAEVN